MNQGHGSLIDEDREFQRYYAQHLRPLEQRFETLRKKAVKERNRRIAAALVAWLAAVGGTGYFAHPIGEFWPFVGFFCLVTGIGLGMWAWLPAGAHNLRLQEQVLTRIVPFFGNVRYKPEPDLNPSRYHDWKVLPSFSKTYAEDQIDGNYRGVPLKLAEVRLEYQTRTRSTRDNSRSTYIAFKGLMIDFEIGQDHPGVTLIRSRGSDMEGRLRLDEDLNEVGAGSGFEVFATTDAPGASLADAGFLERLAEVSTQFEARQLFASFHANRLVMLIEHKGDYFEMSHRQVTDFARDAERVRDELGRFFAIVDMLQLSAASTQNEKDAGASEDLEFPELEGPKAPDPYDIGGWGCLSAFVMFAAAMSAYLWLLDPELSKGVLLGWSALGGFLMAWGLFQVIRGALRRALGSAILGIILLAGAFTLLYRHLPPDTQALIRSWVQGM